jgi:hypothetical protein
MALVYCGAFLTRFSSVEAGTSLTPPFQTSIGVVGMLICFDVRMSRIKLVAANSSVAFPRSVGATGTIGPIGGCNHVPKRIHDSNRQGALVRPTSSQSHRNPILRDCSSAGWPTQRKARQLRTQHDCLALGGTAGRIGWRVERTGNWHRRVGP